MKGTPHKTRRILHVDLDPFFVSVERSQDASLRGRPVIIGGSAGAPFGVVAAASDEARAAGVRPGQTLATARRLCPAGAFRAGDLETYARTSEEVTAILLASSRRVERPSADEAYIDLTPETADAPGPVSAAERIKDEIQRRLGLDASLGLASSRLAARVASRWARPRGLLVVLPGYEASFMRRQAIRFLPDLPPYLEAALEEAGLTNLGAILEAEDAQLAAAVGSVAAARLRDAARGVGEEPIAIAAPPNSVQEETAIRDKGSDLAALLTVVEGLATRACRKLRPFDLGAGSISVEVRRGDRSQRVSQGFDPPLADEEAVAGAAQELAGPLLDPAGPVRAVEIRLGRLSPPSSQAPLFPGLAGTHARRSSVR